MYLLNVHSKKYGFNTLYGEKCLIESTGILVENE